MSVLPEKAEKHKPKSAQIKDAAFKWDDPLDLESQLTEEERMVRDTARDYAQEKLFPACSTPIATAISTPTSCARWARSACSARPSRRTTAAPASATSATG